MDECPVLSVNELQVAAAHVARLTSDTFAAVGLLELVREHRATCNNEDCRVSSSLLLPTYERLVGRSATPDERAEFA